MRWLAAQVLTACLLLTPTIASADAKDVARAENYFDAGAEAYAAGQYRAAAEAFEKAYALLPSPALLFSAAQAHRRQFMIDEWPYDLEQAVALYRRYLQSGPAAERRDESAQALEILVPLLAKTKEDPNPDLISGGKVSARRDARRPPRGGTRLLLSAAGEGAEVSVDGGAYVLAPHVAQVAAGDHRVTIRATGYRTQVLTVRASLGELTPHHATLVPVPATLSVHAAGAGIITVDGRVWGQGDATVVLDPGAHFVAVTSNGHRAFSETITLERGGSRTIDVALDVTGQRVAAWSLLAVGLGGAVATGALTAFALGEQSDALALEEKRIADGLSLEERERYTAAADARDDLALAAGVSGAITLLAGATGALLFAFDETKVVPPSTQPTAPQPRIDFTVGAAAASLRVRF